MVGFLLDASALLNVIKMFGERGAEIMRGSSIMDLTVYEVGNGVWRLVYMLKEIDYDGGLKLLEAVERLSFRLNVVGIEERLLKVYDLSIKEGLTFYDAAYISAAQSTGLALVTDDVELANKAGKYINVLSSNDLSAQDMKQP